MSNKNPSLAFAAAVLGALLSGPATAIITLHTSDFIADADRTGFNGFEAMQETTDWSGPHTEAGITVEQFDLDDNGQLIALGGIRTACANCGREGARSWNPNLAGVGFTRITRADGGDFDSIGFLVGTGYEKAGGVLYRLFNDGTEVLNGSFAPGFTRENQSMDYLGFSGGGFDTLWLRDFWVQVTLPVEFGDATANWLSLDSIEAVWTTTPPNPNPEPATLALLGLGLAGLALLRRNPGARRPALS